MRTVDPAPAWGLYPERIDLPQSALDRLSAKLSWHFHCIFRRRIPEPAAFALLVEKHASAAGNAPPLASQLSALRYRLRREGLQADLVAECFGWYGAARARCGAERPTAAALGAAQQLLTGGVVDLADPLERTQALALAATVLAIHGTPVHLLCMSHARVRRIADVMQPAFDALGVSFARLTGALSRSAREAAFRSAIVCGTHREIAVAYLQDRLQMAGKSRLLLRALAGDAALSGKERQLLLPGLRFALVEDADLVMLDDAYAPVTISMETEQSQERLLYEQVLELARACEQESDFTYDDQGVHLTDAGSQRLTRLVAPLGGIWGAQQRREELVCMGLAALHVYQRDVDYQVQQGRVVFPPPDPAGGTDAEGPDPVMVKLVELKEGCRLAVRNVLARISVPRFFRRYLNVAGICADARGLEEDFWALYGMKTTLVGRHPGYVQCNPRIFRTVDAKRAAVIATVSKHALNGPVVVAVRTSPEAQALVAAMTQAGIKAGLLRGVMDEAEQAVLAGLEHAGGVAVALFPAESVVQPGTTRPPCHLIVAELHDARRHVIQIGRNFGAHSCEMLLSMDEDGVAARSGQIAAGIASLHDATADELPQQQSRWIANLAQREAEQARALMRRDMILRDDYMSELLAFSGPRE